MFDSDDISGVFHHAEPGGITSGVSADLTDISLCQVTAAAAVPNPVERIVQQTCQAPATFPVPLQQSLQALYGVGLLVPEILLIAGGLVWLRQREA